MLEVDIEVERRELVVSVELSVGAGERLALFGPSGAGKTTVLETMAGLVRPGRGRIALNGRVLTSTGRPRVEVPPAERRVGLLRQDPALFPHLNVTRNLTYSRSSSDREARLTHLVRRLELTPLLEASPAALSGGQAQRVALARLLLADHDAWLFDEPFSGLDLRLRRLLGEVVQEATSEREVPAVLVAHELPEAQAFADRLAVIDAGRILQVGAPAEVVRVPASRRVAELVGFQGFVPLADGEIVAGVHPERVVAGARPDAGHVIVGTVTAVRPSGGGFDLDVVVSSPSCAGTEAPAITCHLAEAPAGPGGSIDLTLVEPPLFGADGALMALPDAEAEVGSGR